MIKQIAKLLDSNNVEVVCAAATVLGELKPKDKEARSALEKALKSSDETIQQYALASLEKLGIAKSLAKVVPLLGSSGNIRHRAAQIFLEQGKKGETLLREKLKTAGPFVRRGILGVLGQTGGKDTAETLLDSMMDEDFEVVRTASNSVIEHVKQMNDKDRKEFTKKVHKFLKQPKLKKNVAATVGVIKVLGYLSNPVSVPTLLQFLAPKLDAKIRTHALNSLGHIPLDAKAKDVAKKLLPLLEDKDGDVVERSLRVLQKVQPPADAADRLAKLIKKSPQPQVRIYAARALGQLGSAKAAGVLTEALFSSDPQLAGTASGAFRGNTKFADALVKALDREKDTEKAWKIANILRTYGKALKKPVLRKFMTTFLQLMRKGEDIGRVYFEILRSTDPDGLRDAVLKEGRGLLKKKKFEDAERILRLVDRDDMATDDSVYALAIARLATLPKDLSQAHRDRSHAVSLFLRLSRNPKFQLSKKLQKDAGVLKPLDFLYLGFCLTERVGMERDEGGKILKFVAKKWSKKQEGKTAKQKLRTQGL